jgi:hypothetical protein
MAGQLHALAALFPRKEPQYPLDRRLVVPQSRSGRCEEENNLAPAGNLTPDRRPIAIPSELESRTGISVLDVGEGGGRAR